MYTINFLIFAFYNIDWDIDKPLFLLILALIFVLGKYSKRDLLL